MPTARHLTKRQAWQDFLLLLVISHSLDAGQLYSILPCGGGVKEQTLYFLIFIVDVNNPYQCQEDSRGIQICLPCSGTHRMTNKLNFVFESQWFHLQMTLITVGFTVHERTFPAAAGR